MRIGSTHFFISVSLILLFTFQFGISVAQELSEIAEFTKKLSYKGPIIGGTQKPLSEENSWVGDYLMYPSTTRYVNWEFSFSYSSLKKSIKTKIRTQILKAGKKIGETFFEIVLDKGTGAAEYIHGFGSPTEWIWSTGLYEIVWSIEGMVFAKKEISILDENLTKKEIIKSLRNDVFEIYFYETTESKRDYTYANNYRFPQERVGLIAWRITFNLPYNINSYDLKAKVKIRPIGIEHIEKIIIFNFNSSNIYTELSDKIRWFPDKNWPRGGYRLEVLVEDRVIAHKDFSII